jgi:hypothetical protein
VRTSRELSWNHASRAHAIERCAGFIARIDPSRTDVFGQELRSDQELVRFLFPIRREEAHAIRVDVARRRGELTHAQNVEHAILETATGRLLENELGRAIRDDLSIDLRQSARSDHPDARAVMWNIQPALRAQTVQANSVVCTDAEFIDLDGRRRELGARDEQH